MANFWDAERKFVDDVYPTTPFAFIETEYPLF